MKNSKSKLIVLPFLALLLTGCKLGNSKVPSEGPSSTEITEPNSEVPVSSEEASSAREIVSVEDATHFEIATTENYGNRALDESIGMTSLNSVGEQKILVVPVVFTDTTNKATEDVRTMIDKAFFGESEDTGWESVASFYHKSSYGKLTLTGEVLPYFYSQWSTYEFSQLEVSETQEIGEGNYWDQTHHLIEEIYNTLDAETFLEYDADGDGHVDALWMVYIANIMAQGGTDTDPFWAYKFYWNREPNEEKPTPNVYAWASYLFADEGVGYNFNVPDAHTYIHETGHLLGLPDYYDYEGKSAPAGALDMMDFNIVDHNMYSKYRLNWSKPYVVNGHADIKLRPAESSGDFIIIKDGWNGHAYDEYILIEYYTPTGLNEQDSRYGGYQTRMNSAGTRGFSINGVKIWHVDSRLITYEYEIIDEEAEEAELKDAYWTDEIVPENDLSYTAIGPSNTGEYSETPEGEGSPFKLLHLLNAQDKSSWLTRRAVATNTALFQTGDYITADGWIKHLRTSETFNDGTPVGYSIDIGEMDENGVQIYIRKAADLA